jgi:hypothetical protein
MTLTYDTQHLITITAYATASGKSRKTVTRMIDDGRLPQARKVDGVWVIPADAVPLDASSTNTVATIDYRQPAALELVTSVLDVLEQMPAYLTLTQAARLLGVPRAAIEENPDLFDAVAIGRMTPDGERAWMIPQATIRRIRG